MQDKKQLLFQVEEELKRNNNKISVGFINTLVGNSEVLYLHPTPCMRLCVIRLPSGHEVLGKAQVLDANNDVPDIGQKVAKDNAVNEIWSLCGSIAKALMELKD